VLIDGQTLSPHPYLDKSGTNHLYLERRDGRWLDVLPQRVFTDRLRRMQKAVHLQGPIDDAFMDSFVCVRGTGTPWHEATQKVCRGRILNASKRSGTSICAATCRSKDRHRDNG